MKGLLLLGLFAFASGELRASNLFDLFRAGQNNDITAVASKKSKSYVRIQLANGRFIPETYVFGPGGVWSGSKADFSIDKLKFLDVAHMIAAPLASRDYVPGKDPNTTKLLIMVYWGTSHGEEHATDTQVYDHLKDTQDTLRNMAGERAAAGTFLGKGFMGNWAARRDYESAVGDVEIAASMVNAQNDLRDQDDQLNVMMLGYDSWWQNTQKYVNTPMDFARQDLLDEIEEDRYFVVLMAYDFQALRKKKKARELWETRFSIREHHHAFNEDLPAMAQYASQYFGQDSNGLIHEAIPLGKVKVGPVQSLGEVPPK
jgi:hypothetical protein